MNNYLTGEIFLKTLYYRSVPLTTAAEVVQFSFITQPSICALDLELCQSYEIGEDNFNGDIYPSLSYSKCFINTEEKCKKVLAPSRNLLYILNLDLPKGREWSLKNSAEPENLGNSRNILHIGKIRVGANFFIYILYEIIAYACENTHHGFKALRWLLNFNGFNGLENFQLDLLPYAILDHFADCMQPGISDTDFVKECLKKLDFMDWIKHSENPGCVVNILHQFHRLGKELEDIPWSWDFVNCCLLHHSFAYVKDALKFVNEPIFNAIFILLTEREIKRISALYPSMKLIQYLDRRDKRRNSLLLYLYWSYLNRSEQLSEAAECLRVIWSSVPDAFLRYEEIVSALEKDGHSLEEIEDVYTFYSEAVDEIGSKVEPRFLRHYCRVIIRKQLWRRGMWLPDGIRLTSLPPSLQAYLNLE